MPRLCVLSVLLLIVPSIYAQDASTGAIRGTVADATGSRIPGATVVLVNAATGLRSSAVSNFEGYFAFDVLPPGDYSARAVASGMSPQTTPKLHVDVDATTEVNFKMQVAGVKETVTVSGEPQLVETQPSPLFRH